MDILFFAGLMLACGFIGGKISNRFKFPAVVGYLVMGLFLGPSFLNILNLELLENMGIFNDLALGVVAFIIGSEMRISTLRKIGKGIVTIIFSESFGAFLLVFAGVYFLTHKMYLALIFGAMAPASAPAGTAVVLQEYRAKGPLTNALYAVVGLDDGLAIIIYAFAAALAKVSITGSGESFLNIVKGPTIEILGAVVLGGIFGFILGYIARRIHNKKEILSISLAMVMLCSGVSVFFHVSLILANLSLGMMFANSYLYANRRAVEAVNFVSVPIYTIFFVIAGAHLQISLLPAMGVLGVLYIVCRSLGLIGGAFFGTTITKADPVLRKYLGLGILSQAGVAIGLAIMATRDFSMLGQAGKDLAVLVINTIAATTIVFEIIGPIATKFAIQKAGEIGKAKT
ncbi:MAG: cation:proton antiporter [Candidatus Omnitrophota bacterium]|nr:cation:proton antiporter [Candidatus Omnitrophota bacterium]